MEGETETTEDGREILPFQMGYLPEFYQKKAEAELGETPEKRQRCLEILKGMIEEDKHFRGLTFDEDFLLQYLRCRKFDAKKACNQLKAFVKLRKENKDMFSQFKFETISISTRKKILTFLPYRCQDGCAIMLVKIDNWIPGEFSVEEVKRMVVVMLLQSLRDPMTQVNGFKAIIDVKSNPIRQLRHISPKNVRLVYYGTKECSPGRFTEIHVLNQSVTFKAAWLLVKPFLSAKLKSRLHFHSSTELLLDYFPRACLPVEYGGDLVEYDMTDWLCDVMQPEKIQTIGGGAKILDD